MGRNIVLGLALGVGLGLFGVACGSSKTDNGGGTDSAGGADAAAGSGAGAAAGGSCAPLTKRCVGQNVMACDQLGGQERLEISCVEGLRCVEEGATAHCDTRACTPGQALCNGNVATTCDADGSGPKSGGVSCKSQLCMAGKCVPVECEAGALLCNNDDLYTCGDDGASITLLDDCAPNEVCDTEAGKCLPRLCTPDQALCEGSVAKTCNAFGSGWQPGAVDCADDDSNCVAGKCSKQICMPGQRDCRDDNVVQCSVSGEEQLLVQSCNHASEHCEATSGGFAFCFADVCTPGEIGCDGNAVKTCDDEGLYPVDGEDCGDGWCSDGACHERTCVEGTYFCQESDVYFCNYQAPPQLYMACGDEMVCRSASAVSDPNAPYGIFCGEPSCTPGATACLGNQLGKCAADGESLTQVTSDCAADGKVCTAEPQCAASAVDLLGVDESLQPMYTDTFAGNVIDVTSSRKLTQLRAGLSFLSSRQVRWVIYEESGSSFVAKIDKVATVSGGGGYVASPAFSFQLEAGKRYLVGFAITGGDISTYYDTAPYPAHVSFGSVYGLFSTAYAAKYDYLDSFSHDAVLHLEVTTEPS